MMKLEESIIRDIIYHLDFPARDHVYEFMLKLLSKTELIEIARRAIYENVGMKDYIFECICRDEERAYKLREFVGKEVE